MTALKFIPKKNKHINSLVSIIPTLDKSIFESGPVQFYFPDVFRGNVDKIKNELTYFSFPTSIFFAHKANKSKVFVREARKAGIDIDVASLQELEHALSEGFSGENIECTGIKNEQFIEKSIAHNCLLVVDSLDELRLINKYASKSHKPRILFRISNPFSKQGGYTRTTRFGITREEFIELIKGKELQNYDVEGLHLHFDEYIPENKATMITELLSMYTYLFQNNIFPKILNIGGGYRFPLIEESEKESIMESIEKTSFEQVSYAQTIIGLEKGRNGKLSKTLVNDKLFPLNLFEFLKKVIDHNIENKTLIDELNLTLGLEPGYALLDNCGVIVMRVLGTKIINESKSAVIVDGNMYNLSTQMKKWVTDPIVLSRDRTPSNESYEAFVMGNLCKEDDVLLDRKIVFSKQPRTGDLLLFCNTAGYSGSFEDTDAILQPKVKNYVFTIDESGKTTIKTEREYLERNNDN